LSALIVLGVLIALIALIYRLIFFHCFGTLFKNVKRSDDYTCDHCQSKGSTKTHVDVWRLPDILVIHMKRFVYTMYVRGKLNNLVHYPLDGLDMAPFLSKNIDGSSSGGGGGGDKVYDLFAAVHHIGTMNGGHYVASCKVGEHL